MRKLLVLVATVALTFVLAAPASANHSWGKYHWARTSNPFTLKLGDNVSTAWDSYLSTASGDWTNAPPLDTTIVAGAGLTGCGPVSGRVEVCNANYGNNGWLGVATIWIFFGKHITQGTVKVNDFYFDQTYYNDTNAKQHVMCQEVGHTFGLAHQRSATSHSCMDDQNGLKDPTFAHPNQHDYDQLVTIYSHTDGYTTVTSASLSTKHPAGGSEDDDAVPAGAGPQHGKVFVKDLGGGRLVISFVIWATQGEP